MQRDSIDFSSSDVGKLFRRFLFPTVMGMVFSAVFVITDGIFVGRGIGSDALASVNIVAPLFTLGTGLGLMFGMGGSVVASINLAQGKRRVAEINITQSLALPALLIALLSALLIHCHEPLLMLLGTPGELMVPAREYLVWFTLFLAPLAVFNILMFIVRLDGAPGFAMACNIMAACINIALDYLFVWEFHWGMAGGAWATVIGQAATMLLAIGYLVRRRVGFLPPKAGEVLPLWGALLKVAAAPIGLTFSPNITLMVMNHFLLRYGGALAIAVYGCIDYVLSTIYMLLQGVGDGSQPLISRAYGAGDFGELRRTGARAYRAAFSITAVCIVALFLTRSVIGVLFGASAEANAGVTARLPLFLATLPLLAYTRVTIAYFYATEKTALSYVLVFSEPVLTFVVLLILPQLLKLTGVWLAIPAAQALTFCIAVPARRRTQRARELPA